MYNYVPSSSPPSSPDRKPSPTHARSPSADDVLLHPRKPRKALSPGIAERKREQAFIDGLEQIYGKGGQPREPNDWTHSDIPKMVEGIKRGSRYMFLGDGDCFQFYDLEGSPLLALDHTAKYGITSADGKLELCPLTDPEYPKSKLLTYFLEPDNIDKKIDPDSVAEALQEVGLLMAHDVYYERFPEHIRELKAFVAQERLAISNRTGTPIVVRSTASSTNQSARKLLVKQSSLNDVVTTGFANVDHRFDDLDASQLTSQQMLLAMGTSMSGNQADLGKSLGYVADLVVQNQQPAAAVAVAAARMPAPVPPNGAQPPGQLPPPAQQQPPPPAQQQPPPPAQQQPPPPPPPAQQLICSYCKMESGGQLFGHQRDFNKHRNKSMICLKNRLVYFEVNENISDPAQLRDRSNLIFALKNKHNTFVSKLKKEEGFSKRIEDFLKKHGTG